RNTSSLPESFLKNIDNEHRKLINLDGEWNITCSDPNINSKVQVPFCYEFRAPVFCTRSFSVQFDNPGSYNYIIYCDGINYQCEISINDRFIVKHEGGYTQFSSIIQDGTIKEENHIDIKMDNYLDNEKT